MLNKGFDDMRNMRLVRDYWNVFNADKEYQELVEQGASEEDIDKARIQLMIAETLYEDSLYYND